jgi:hypothetical protein
MIKLARRAAPLYACLMSIGFSDIVANVNCDCSLTRARLFLFRSCHKRVVARSSRHTIFCTRINTSRERNDVGMASTGPASRERELRRTKQMNELLTNLRRFVPIRLAINFYDASADTNDRFVSSDKNIVSELWNFLNEHAENPRDSVSVPSTASIWIGFYDINDKRHVVTYDSSASFVIDDLLRGDLTRKQTDWLWAFEPILEDKLRGNGTTSLNAKE